MRCLILPEMTQGKWVEVNLNELALQAFDGAEDNPMKSADFQDTWLDSIKTKLECDHTYGGFLEDRTVLWRGFETQPNMLHLGIDINNLQPLTPVSTPCDAEVFHVMTLTGFNGWGARIILKMDTPFQSCSYLMYGHLDPESLPVIGTRVQKGDVVGKIGDITKNGDWFCHLHVQLNTDYFMKLFEKRLDKLDGYALTDEEVKGVHKLVSDPSDLVFNW